MWLNINQQMLYVFFCTLFGFRSLVGVATVWIWSGMECHILGVLYMGYDCPLVHMYIHILRVYINMRETLVPLRFGSYRTLPRYKH